MLRSRLNTASGVLLILILLCSYPCLFTAEQISPFTCAGGKAWPVDATDNRRAQRVFQNWLLARQNNPLFCANKNRVYTNINGFGTGIGSTFDQAIKFFFKYLELGIIYRPMDKWLWATGFNNSYGTHSIDCFSQPLSYCKLLPIEELTTYYDANEADSFSETALDICTMAKLSKKPTVWAFGQALHYMLRPGPHVAQYIRKRMDLVFATTAATTAGAFTNSRKLQAAKSQEIYSGSGSVSGSTISRRASRRSAAFLRSPDLRMLSQTQPGAGAEVDAEIETHFITVGVHARGGKPWDGRRTLQVRELMAVVDARVAELEREPEPHNETISGVGGISVTPLLRRRRLRVSQVFICSDTQESNVKSTEFMTTNFPRNFTYVILPHLNYSVGTEAEAAVRHSLDDGRAISLLDIYSEYLADIEILVKSDVYIGMYSNVYLMVAALRAARHPERPPSYTSYIDQHSFPYKLTFEGRGRTHIWVDNYGETAFDGPNPFWNE